MIVGEGLALKAILAAHLGTVRRSPSSFDLFPVGSFWYEGMPLDDGPRTEACLKVRKPMPFH